MPPMTPAEFDVLAARNGIAFTDAQKATLREVLPAIEAFARRMAGPLPRAAEPALTLAVAPRSLQTRA